VSPESETKLRELREMNDDELKELIGEASDSLSEEDGKF